MKKIQQILDKWFEKLDKRWRTLPVHKQQKYTMLFFFAYVVITAGVVLKVWFDAGQPEVIRHIENPVKPKKRQLPPFQDSLSTIFQK